jgi:hypothetical protein
MVMGSVQQLLCLLWVAAVERNYAMGAEQPGDERIVTGLGRWFECKFIPPLCLSNTAKIEHQPGSLACEMACDRAETSPIGDRLASS